MKKIKHVIAFYIMIMLLCCMTSTVYAEGESVVNFRLVLPKYMTYSSCSVYLDKYDSMSSTVPIDSTQFSISRTGLWQREIQLEPGYYQVSYVSVVGSWSAMESGVTERFEVKGDKMTVYIAVDTKDNPAKMPDQWLIYGEDKQIFHIWDGTPDMIIGNTPQPTSDPNNPENISTPTPLPGEELPGVSTDTEEDPNGPGRNTKPPIPSLAPQKPTQSSVNKSAKIGDIIFYILLGLVFVACIFLLRKIQRDRGIR